MEVVGIKFQNTGKIYYFSPLEEGKLNIGDKVVAETVHGPEIGEVVIPTKEIIEEEIISELKPILRKATDEDLKLYEERLKEAKEVFKICLQKIEEHNSPMKLVDAHLTLDGNKIIFYFTAEARVDFRDLVRELASIFHKRIEMRQIGVRDKAKMIGGLGSCGRVFCCSSFINDFDLVSIKMAKNQNLPLNPSKISGACGRLMCCLCYEDDFYSKARTIMPKEGTEVLTPSGKGIVSEVDFLKQLIKVKLEEGEEIFCLDELLQER